MTPSSTYPSRFYDAIHVGNPGDLAFYRRFCAGADPVLELGCGTGRVGVELIGAGHRVTGIDLNQEALDIAAPRGIEACLADMRRFDLGRTFERVLIPYNSLYCLLEVDEVLECLRCVRRHLSPDGLLAFDCYSMDGWHHNAGAGELPPEEEFEASSGRIRVDGYVYDVFEKTEWVPSRQRADTVYRHVPRDGGETLTAAIPQHYLLSEQVVDLVARAELALESIRGGFKGERFRAASETMVVTARRDG